MTMRDRFIAADIEPEWYDTLQFRDPGAYLPAYFLFDAVVSLGIAACNTPGLFTGRELLDQVKKTEFQGITGLVQFDPETGSRLGDTVGYRLENVFLSDELSTDTKIRFISSVSALVQGTNYTPVNSYYQLDYNLISNGALVYGWTFGAFVLTMSLGWIVWIVLNRNIYVVRAGRPIFLCQLCAGTFIMALTVIPLSMQKASDGGVSRWDLDTAYMSIPWLLAVGFVIAFGAIIAKALRLKKVMQNSTAMRRKKVEAHHVVHPFLVMMILNVGLLLACTFVAPFRWERITYDNGFDNFDRSLQSYGTCGLLQNVAASKSYYITVPIFLGVLLCGVSSFPAEMSESLQICIATVSLFETWAIGGPLLLVIKDNPTANFLIITSFVNVVCLSLLLPILVPKYLMRFQKEQTGRSNPVNVANIIKPTTNGADDSYYASIFSNMGGPHARLGKTTTVGGPSSLRSDFPSSVNHLQNPSHGEIALDYRRSSEIPCFGPESARFKGYSLATTPRIVTI